MHLIQLGGSLLVLHLLSTVGVLASPLVDYGKIEILRDQWGIPHIFSDTDAGALYGLGYFTAEECGFQMTCGLRIIQGRLAEVIGERQRGERRETSVDNDRKMRRFGRARGAAGTARNPDSSTTFLLEAPWWWGRR